MYLFLYRKEHEALQNSQKGKAKEIQSLLEDLDCGDWFVLHQIGKNVDPYYFNEFINELALMKKILRKKRLTFKKRLTMTFG